MNGPQPGGERGLPVRHMRGASPRASRPHSQRRAAPLSSGARDVTTAAGPRWAPSGRSSQTAAAERPQTLEVASMMRVESTVRPTALGLADKVVRLRERLRDPEWRRYGYLLMGGKMLGVALLLGIVAFAM